MSCAAEQHLYPPCRKFRSLSTTAPPSELSGSRAPTLVLETSLALKKIGVRCSKESKSAVHLIALWRGSTAASLSRGNAAALGMLQSLKRGRGMWVSCQPHLTWTLTPGGE